MLYRVPFFITTNNGNTPWTTCQNTNQEVLEALLRTTLTGMIKLDYYIYVLCYTYTILTGSYSIQACC